MAHKYSSAYMLQDGYIYIYYIYVILNTQSTMQVISGHSVMQDFSGFATVFVQWFAIYLGKHCIVLLHSLILSMFGMSYLHNVVVSLINAVRYQQNHACLLWSR